MKWKILQTWAIRARGRASKNAFKRTRPLVSGCQGCFRKVEQLADCGWNGGMLILRSWCRSRRTMHDCHESQILLIVVIYVKSLMHKQLKSASTRQEMPSHYNLRWKCSSQLHYSTQSKFLIWFKESRTSTRYPKNNLEESIWDQFTMLARTNCRACIS